MVYPVVADFIDKTHFSFCCPFCNARHKHGNMGDFYSTRWEYRISHCLQYNGEFKILICKETKRKLSKLNQRKYEKYLEKEKY